MADARTEEVVLALKRVIDPELHIDVHTLGLIYDIRVEGEGVHVLMTLTTPLCPYAAKIEEDVRAACSPHADPVTVTVTFDPPWTPPEGLREILGV